MKKSQTYGAIVIGMSAGGVKLLKKIATSLPGDFSLPLIVVQHVSDASDDTWTKILDEQCDINVKEAEEKEKIKPRTIYLAPANYHLLVEREHTFSLTVDERVNYARPSIDVLFETAADAYREKLIGIVCTGANFDGAKGLLRIKELGGLTIVQEPETAEAKAMPLAAIETVSPEYIVSPEDIIELLLKTEAAEELKTGKTT